MTSETTHSLRSRLLAAWLLAALTAATQPAFGNGYVPDVAEFDGSNAMTFEPAEQLDLAGGGTLEFWVVPDWTEDPGYDPAIVSNAGPEGASYLIAMLRGRDGLAFVSGAAEDVVAFDFSDGQMHHVAMLSLEDGTAFYVDGQLSAVSELVIEDRPSAGLWIGAIDGENNQFHGAIAGLRVWDTVVAQETLVSFAMQDVFAGDHPDLDRLAALSDFGSGELLLVDTTDDAAATTEDQ